MQLAAHGVHYRHKRAPYSDTEIFDAEDFLARLLMHIPAPRLHQTAYYGAYASVVRARRSTATKAQPPSGDGGQDEGLPTTAERRRLRRQWAQLIRRIYEADPLTCRCGAQMRVVSFILDPKVVTKILRHLAIKAPGRERGPPPALAS